MPSFKANGISIAYHDAGTGPPIVLVHGFADTKDLWQPQIAALRDSYRVIAPDLRGHGATSAPEDPALYQMTDAIADLRALFDHLGLEAPILGGLSLGAYLSLEFYRRSPDRVRALLLLACGPGFRNPATIATWNAERIERGNRLAAKAERLVALGEAPVHDRAGSPLIGLANVSRVMMLNTAAQDILPTIAVPTLVLVGEQDSGYLAAADLLERRIPGAIRATLPNAGHRLNLDQPGLTNGHLRAFLSRLDHPADGEAKSA